MDGRRYLIDEPPILVQPSLAVALDDLNKAIVLQQLHYWVQRSNNVRDGKRWVYNTTKEWQQQFPFWSEATIRRAMKELRDLGIVVTANYNQMPMDRTLWYSIDYARLDTILQNQQTNRSNCAHGSDQSDQTNNQRILPETNTTVVVDDVTLADVFEAWNNIKPGFNFFDSEALKAMVDEFGAQHVKQAIIDANKNGKRVLSYVEGILKNRANGTEKPQQQQRQGSGRRLSKVEESLAAVDRVMAMAERGELDEWLK